MSSYNITCCRRSLGKEELVRAEDGWLRRLEVEMLTNPPFAEHLWVYFVKILSALIFHFRFFLPTEQIHSLLMHVLSFILQTKWRLKIPPFTWRRAYWHFTLHFQPSFSWKVKISKWLIRRHIHLNEWMNCDHSFEHSTAHNPGYFNPTVHTQCFRDNGTLKKTVTLSSFSLIYSGL